MRNTPSILVLIVLSGSFPSFPPATVSAEVLLKEDFSGTVLDPAKWIATEKAGKASIDRGLVLQPKSSGEQVHWNQLYVLGKTALPRAAGTSVDFELEWDNVWFLVGLVPADREFRSWESDLRLGFHLHGPQVWALSGPQDFGRGTLLGDEGIDGNSRGTIRLRMVLGGQRGAAFLIDYGKGWKPLRDTRRDPGADSCQRYRPAFLLSRSDTGRPGRLGPILAGFHHDPFDGQPALGVYHLRDHNPVWTETGRRMIDRLLELAIHKDDYCYFPALMYEPRAKYDRKAPQAAMPQAILGGEINGRTIQGAAQFYRLTGYEPAKTLAAKQARFMRFHDGYFGPNGEFLAERHFHAHTIYLLSMLVYAAAVGDKDLVEFVRKGYEWAKTPAAGSSNLLGFFPEIADPKYKSCESCEIADMIALALKLSAAGAGDYYADAERWTRNHFAESQLTDCGWLRGQAAQRPVQRSFTFNETAKDVPERNVGAFAGWSAANDWWVQGPGIMHCCTGNAARTLYYLWQHALEHRDGHLRGHLLLNRASRWADVYSHIPYAGRVDPAGWRKAAKT